MGYYVSNMIGIRTGGVFSGDVDIDDMRSRIGSVVMDMREGDNPPNLGDKTGDPSHCMSQELGACKGSYVVIAGVFNYWTFDSAREFARRLSSEFGTEVMIMSWDEECDHVNCQIYLAGKELFEINENVIGQTIRRIT